MSRQKPPDHPLSRADMDRIIKRQYAELARLRAENEQLRNVMRNVADTPAMFPEEPYCSQCGNVLATTMSESLQEALAGGEDQEWREFQDWRRGRG